MTPGVVEAVQQMDSTRSEVPPRDSESLLLTAYFASSTSLSLR